MGIIIFIKYKYFYKFKLKKVGVHYLENICCKIIYYLKIMNIYSNILFKKYYIIHIN